MPSLIDVPEPHPDEERRLMAESIRQTNEMLDLVAVNANKLLPGDAAEEFAKAWEQDDGPRQQLGDLASNLLRRPMSKPYPYISDDYLNEQGMTGPSARLKRNFLSRLRDEILRYLKPNKNAEVDVNWITKSELKAGGEALGEYFEGAATLVKSVCPYGNEVVEFLSYAKQLCKFGAKFL